MNDACANGVASAPEPSAFTQAVLEALDEQIRKLESELAQVKLLLTELEQLKRARAALLGEKTRIGSRWKLGKDAVSDVLLASTEPLTPVEIAEKVGADATVVRSHLNRHLGVRYRKDEGGWVLIKGDEWLSHAAAAASMHLDYGYPCHDIALDVDAFDVLVYSPTNQPLIALEVKKAESEVDAMLTEMLALQGTTLGTHLSRATLECREEVPEPACASSRVLPSGRARRFASLRGQLSGRPHPANGEADGNPTNP
jgi:hypothetical protein